MHAVVVPVAGATIDPAELIAFSGQYLAGYKKPKGVDVVDALPKTTYGKVAKKRGAGPVLGRPRTASSRRRSSARAAVTDVWIAGCGHDRVRAGRRTARTVWPPRRSRPRWPTPGLTPAEVGQVFVGNAAAGLLLGQEMIRGQVFLRRHRPAGRADRQRRERLRLQLHRVHRSRCTAVAGRHGRRRRSRVGVEKMVVPEKARVFGALAAATDTLRRPDMRALVGGHHARRTTPDGASAPRLASFMDHYAHKAAVLPGQGRRRPPRTSPASW